MYYFIIKIAEFVRTSDLVFGNGRLQQFRRVVDQYPLLKIRMDLFITNLIMMLPNIEALEDV